MSNLIRFHNINNSYYPFYFMKQELDNFFNVFEGDTVISINPEFEFKENIDGIEIMAELPGINEEDIDISIKEGILTISGEKKSPMLQEGDILHVGERRYGSFSRSFSLPYEPEENDILAIFKNGVLKINIPRPEELKPYIYKIPLYKELKDSGAE
jgi:HSP20 family protein